MRARHTEPKQHRPAAQAGHRPPAKPRTQLQRMAEDSPRVQALYAIQRLAKQAHQRHPPAPWDHGATPAVIQRGANQSTPAEPPSPYHGFQSFYDVAHGDFLKKQADIERILNILPELPLSYRYLANRWAHYGPEFTAFFADFKTRLDRPESRRGARRLGSRQRLYNTSGDWRRLLVKTHSTLVALEPSFQRVFVIDKRRAIFAAEREGALTKRERRLNPDGLDPLTGENPNDTLAHDPDLSVSKTGWTGVNDDGAPINSAANKQAATAYIAVLDEQKKINKGVVEEEWHSYLHGDEGRPPSGANNTKFHNIYHKNAVIMGENYRPMWKTYFASDVFFDQWLRAEGKDPSTVLNLPRTFPQFFYRNHIDNQKTLAAAEATVGHSLKQPFSVTVDASDAEAWDVMKVTPNVGSTLNIVAEFNRINAARGGATYAIKALAMYGPPVNFKFTIGKA